MLQITACQQGRSAITSIQALQNNLVAFSTYSHGIRIFSLDDCKNKTILSIALLGHKTTAICFHPQKEICAFANDTVIYVVSLVDKNILQTIYTHNGTVEILSFIADTSYLMTGTKEGRVMLYRYDGSSGISRLTSFLYEKNKRNVVKNYVSAFATYKHLIASSGYGSCVTVVNLNSHSNKKNFYDSNVRVNALCFVDENLLLYANVQGTVFIQPLKSSKKAKILTMPFSNIKDILYFKGSDFALISGDAKSIVLINIRSAKIIRNKYMSFKDEVTKITLTKSQNLLVVLNNKQILHVNFPKLVDLQNALQKKNLALAFEMVNDDPKLQQTKEYKKIEILYETLYQKAMQALIDSNQKELNNIVALLSKVDNKAKDIDLLYQAYEHFPRFKTFYLEKKYALAYNLSEKFPALKYTLQYKKMEESFKETFTFAQKQILIGRQDIAQDLLSSYMSVLSKRPVINLLLKQNKEFIQFLKALQKKDYSTLNLLSSKYKVFQEIPTFTALKESQEKRVQKIDATIDEGKIDEAVAEIKHLQESTCSQAQLKELYNKAQKAKELLRYYENNDFRKCYELIDENEMLTELTISTLLEKHWQKLMNICEAYALQGDIKSIKETLQELIRVTTRSQRIGDLLRLSFQTKIKQLIAQKKFKNAENIIYSYIDIFGIDKELTVLMKSYEKYASHTLAITQERKEHTKRDSWLNCEIIMNSSVQ